MTVTVPDFQLAVLKDIMCHWHAICCFNKKDLQSLKGKPSYATSCVRLGRIFMSRLLKVLKKLPLHDQGKFHITDNMRADLMWWDKSLPLHSGDFIIKQGTWLPADLFFFTDVCLSGFGAVCGDQFTCIHGEWPEHIILKHVDQKELHISALELLTIVIAVKVWSDQLSGLCVLIACDYEAATCTVTINSGRSWDPFKQQCLFELWHISALFEFEIHAVHIPGRDNTLVDWLSRWSDPVCHSTLKCYNNSS